VSVEELRLGGFGVLLGLGDDAVGFQLDLGHLLPVLLLRRLHLLFELLVPPDVLRAHALQMRGGVSEVLAQHAPEHQHEPHEDDPLQHQERPHPHVVNSY